MLCFSPSDAKTPAVTKFSDSENRWGLRSDWRTVCDEQIQKGKCSSEEVELTRVTMTLPSVCSPHSLCGLSAFQNLKMNENGFKVIVSQYFDTQ